MNIIEKIGLDKITHYFVCLSIFMILRLYMPDAVAAIAAFAIGFLKETIDFFRHSDFSLADLLADTLGIVTGWLAVIISKLF